MNAEAELITSVIITPGNASDGKQFGGLVGRDAEQGLPIETYAGDRGYDDTENHYRLEMMGTKNYGWHCNGQLSTRLDNGYVTKSSANMARLNRITTRGDVDTGAEYVMPFRPV